MMNANVNSVERLLKAEEEDEGQQQTAIHGEAMLQVLLRLWTTAPLMKSLRRMVQLMDHLSVSKRRDPQLGIVKNLD